MPRKLFYQFDRLILKKGVLHRLYIQEDIEYHQLVLPQKLQGKVLEALHDNMGHQALERTLDLLRERVYWPSMTSDTTRWIGECRRCQVARGDYNKPKPILGQIEANSPIRTSLLGLYQDRSSKEWERERSGSDWCFYKVQSSGNNIKSKGTNSRQSSCGQMVPYLWSSQ